MGVKRIVEDTENTVSGVVNNLVSKVENLVPFGKFERITAGFCMAIPFVLMIVDPSGATRNLGLLVIPGAIMLAPQAIGLINKVNGKNSKNDGWIITIVGAIALFGLFLLFTKFFKIESKDSISAYVTMNGGPHVFGMLLSIAAMLFMANGVVYWNKKIPFKEGRWRSLLNVILGFLLLGIVVFPCTTESEIHGVVAILFFVGCAGGTVRRDAKGKKVVHWLVDFGSVLAMAFVAFAYVANIKGWFGCLLCFWPLNAINIFGVEAIALWITGLDFILVSLKRGEGASALPDNITLEELEKRGAKIKHREQ